MLWTVLALSADDGYAIFAAITCIQALQAGCVTDM